MINRTLRASVRYAALVILLCCFTATHAQDDTYDGGTLDEVTVPYEETASKFRQLLDVDMLLHSLGAGKVANDDRLVDFVEGFMERNGIGVLTISYVDSDDLWPSILKNNALKKIEKAPDATLVAGILFFPEQSVDGEKRNFTARLSLEGKTNEVYDLLNISGDDMALISEETSDELIGDQAYSKPKEAQDKVVNAMIAALQKVEQNADPTGPTGQVVTFQKKANQKHGFDLQTYDQLSSDYPTIVVGGQSYPTAWKSLQATQPDEVIAIDTSGQEVTFELDGVPVNGALAQGKYSLSLQGSTDGTEGELLAKVGETTVGKLNTVTYIISTIDLKIVPVNGAGSGISQTALQSALDSIYAPAVASWNVQVLDNQELGNAWDPEGNGLDDGETGSFTNYTDEMNDLIKSFKSQNDRDKDAYYIFLVKKAENPSKLGYMPRKKQWGFVFTNGQSTEALTKTIAHELGHGVYRLEHTFSEKGLPKGQTDNLMDYSDGEELYKYQWDYVHDPASVVTLFDDEEDAASEVKYKEVDFEKSDIDIAAYFSNDVSYITPGGSIITLPISVKPSFTGLTNVASIDQSLYKGVLMGFQKDQKKWTARFVPAGDEYKFKGYAESGTSNYFPPSSNTGQQNVDVLVGQEQPSNCSIDLYKATYSGSGYSHEIQSLFTDLSSELVLIKDNIPLPEGKCETQYLTNIVFASNMTWDEGSRGFTGTISIDSLKTNTSTPDLKSLKGKNILIADYVGLGGKSIGLKSDSKIGSIFLKLASTIKVCITNEKTDDDIINGLKARESVDEFGKFIALESNEMLLWVHFTDDNKSKVIFWFPSSARKEVRDYLKDHSPIGIAALGVAEAGVVIKGLGDMVSAALDSVKIPEAYWNPESPSYKDYMAYVAAVAFPSASDITQLSFDRLTGSSSSQTMSQRKFALACGIVNGVISEVQGVALIASMVGQIMSDANFRAELNEALSNASFSKVYNAVLNSVDKHITTLSELSCASAELLGRDMVVVATFFIGIGEVVQAVKGAKAASEVFSALAKIAKANAQGYARMLVQISKLPRNAIKFAQSGTKKFLRRQSDDVLLATLDEATGLTVNKWGYAKHNADGSFVKESGEMLDADGNTVFLTENAEGKSVFCDKYGACFVKGTLIATALGLMPIESISSGDLVWSYDEITQREELKEVTQTFVKHSGKIITIYAGEEIIRTTPEHPFYTPAGWIRAAQLHKGSILKLLDQRIDYEEQASLFSNAILTKNRLARSSLAVDSISVDEVSSIVYNFSVADFHTYYVGSSKVLVHNSCLPDNLKAIYDELGDEIKEKYLSKIESNDLTAFLSDIDNPNSTLTTAFFNGNTDAFVSWKSVKKYHPQLAKDVKVLESYNSLKKNPQFSKMGFAEDDIAKLQYYSTSTRSASYKEILDDLNTFGNLLESKKITIENFDKVIGVLQRTDGVGDAYKQGVHWMIRDINTNGTVFVGKKIKFEHSIANSRPTTANSSIDLFCENCTPANLKIEYKSGPGSISSSTIKEQFIERDLFNANSLDEIQWRMEGTDFTKGKLVQWMTDNRSSIENLGYDKIKNFYPNDELMNVTNYVDRFINKFKSEANYNSIFK